ncbi:cysteine proteinase inhibitor B-like [Coffea eugenioides]|uniref:cysteine proteinase inhibitor B-like n=1 Tax=Coffea eugenioides TaxID=49369 RepID=UPI000F605236|nr:cysteine proteinase inhibitor B-like [Coffea eugenioides]
MAKSSSSLLTLPSFLLIFFILALFSTTLQVNALGRKVGAREKIEDVKSNKEVQELGEYCVSEYNKSLRKKNNESGAPIIFTSVVEAEKQVVAGIKYYLKIKATTSSGVPKVYDAIVVVRPWVHTKPRQLLNFSPSPATK